MIRVTFFSIGRFRFVFIAPFGSLTSFPVSCNSFTLIAWARRSSLVFSDCSPVFGCFSFFLSFSTMFYDFFRFFQPVSYKSFRLFLFNINFRRLEPALVDYLPIFADIHLFLPDFTHFLANFYRLSPIITEQNLAHFYHGRCPFMMKSQFDF